MKLNHQAEQTEDNVFVFIWEHKFFALFTLVFVSLPLVVNYGQEYIAETSNIILRRIPKSENITNENFFDFCSGLFYTAFLWLGIIMFRKSLEVSGEPGSVVASHIELLSGFVFLLSPFWFPIILNILLQIMI